MTPEQQRAICRITIGDQEDAPHGTGFLVSSGGLVLTALHVLGELARPFVPLAPQARLEFGAPDEGPLWSCTVPLPPARLDVDDDWAMIEIPPAAIPADVVPLRLAGLRASPNPTAWSTWGFPEVRARRGKSYQGTVTAQSERLELFSPGVAAAEGAMVAGISGAPCVVGGDVRALIQRALLVESDVMVGGVLRKAARAQDGTLFAVGVRRILAALGPLPGLEWDDLAPLPFEEHVTQSVQRLYREPTSLRQLAAKLEVAERVVEDDFLPEKLARAALRRRDTLATYQALKDAPIRPNVEHGAAVVRCVGAAAIDAAVAAEVRAGLCRDRGASGLALCTLHPQVATLLLWRARFDADRLSAWNRNIFEVVLVGEESPEAESTAAVAEVRAHLAHKCGKSGAGFQIWLRQTSFVVLVSGMNHPDAVIERLAATAELSKGCFVALVGEAPPAEDHGRWARLRVVTSGLSADAEQELDYCCHDTEKDLASG